MIQRVFVCVVVVWAMAAGLAAQESPRRFTGEPISLNLKDVDVRDFFRLIHELSGLNVIVDSSVQGNIALFLQDVPWDQALDIVIRNNGLVTEIQGNVLRVMTMETAKREHQARRELAEAERAALPRQTIVYRPSYAKAQEVAPILKRFLSPRGEIAVDERTNTLIITDVPEVLPRGGAAVSAPQPPPARPRR